MKKSFVLTRLRLLIDAEQNKNHHLSTEKLCLYVCICARERENWGELTSAPFSSSSSSELSSFFRYRSSANFRFDLKLTKDIFSLRSNSNATDSIVNLDEKAKDIRIHC